MAKINSGAKRPSANPSSSTPIDVTPIESDAMTTSAETKNPLSENSPTAVSPPSRAKAGKSTLGDRVQSLRLNQLPERSGGNSKTLLWIGIAIVCLLSWIGVRVYFATTTKPEVASSETKSQSNTEKKVDSQDQRPAPLSSGAATPTTNPPSRSSADAGSGSSATPVIAPTSLPKPTGKVSLEAKGYITPAHQILVSPKVSGMITTLQVEEGRRVEQGEVLAILEMVDYEADAARARATVRLARERLRELENGNRPEEISQAEAELNEARATLPRLESDYKRNSELKQNNAISAQELQESESDYLSAVQRVERLTQAVRLMRIGARIERVEIARAELEQAEADQMKAEWRLGNCTIRAPISGTILKKNAEVGNLVNPVAFNGSFSLCEMADLSDLEVDLNIQEREISAVFVGQKCRIRAEAYPQRDYEGYVDRLMPIADRAKGAIPVRVKVKIPADEEGIYLKPEMGAIVTFYDEKVDIPARSTAPEVIPTFRPVISQPAPTLPQIGVPETRVPAANLPAASIPEVSAPDTKMLEPKPVARG